jgi:Protein of unknown function (DUF1579)
MTLKDRWTPQLADYMLAIKCFQTSMAIMRSSVITRMTYALAAGVLFAFPGQPLIAEESTQIAAAPSGAGDFDFQRGEWRVVHRVKRPGQDAWAKFEGTCRNRALIDGTANVEEHTFNRPAGVTFGIAIRAYDPKTGLWAIWWVDSRDPHGTLDPPVKGRFENGVGSFYSDYVADGKPTRVRFVWSDISAQSARWEQASSGDGGKTWEVNWIMNFERVR